MTDKEIPYDKIDEILLMVENVIKTDGYCRAGFAIKEVMKCPNKNVLEHDKVKIASLMCKDGKYKYELAVNKSYFDLNIRTDTTSNWFTRNPLKSEIIRIIVTIVVAYITSKFT